MGILAQTFSPPSVNRADVAAECERIALIISSAVCPKKIILFGSAASNNFHAYSDIDLLILLQSQQEIRAARTNLASQKIQPRWPCDYLFVTTDRYELMKDQGGPIFMAHHFGRVLYDQRATI